MLRKISFQWKSIILSAIPLLSILFIVVYQNGKMQKTVETKNLQLARSDLEHIAKGVYSMCESQQELLICRKSGCIPPTLRACSFCSRWLQNC